MELNEAKLHEFLGKMVQDLGAAASTALVLTGDKLGLYKTLAAEGPMSSDELARRTGTNERYVLEWLSAQAASGYVEYNAGGNSFSMTPEQIAVFADEDSPVNMTGGFYALAAVVADEHKVTEAFQTGEGISWGDHDSCLFCGTEKFFKPSYRAHLTSSWIPALDGVEAKLKRGRPRRPASARRGSRSCSPRCAQGARGCPTRRRWPGGRAARSR